MVKFQQTSFLHRMLLKWACIPLHMLINKKKISMQNSNQLVDELLLADKLPANWLYFTFCVSPERWKGIYIYITFWYSFNFFVIWRLVAVSWHINFWTSKARASQVVLVVKKLPANAGDLRVTGLIPGLGRSPGGGHGNPFQYSCLENPMDREAWWATVLGVAKSWTWLKLLSTAQHIWSKTLILLLKSAPPLVFLISENDASSLPIAQAIKFWHNLWLVFCFPTPNSSQQQIILVQSLEDIQGLMT